MVLDHNLESLAAAEIDQLRRDGIEPTAHEIVHIIALVARTNNPRARLSLARGKPVVVGGVTLWPMTLASHVWYEAIGEQLNVDLRVLALAYAMAFGRRELPYDIAVVRNTLKEWKRDLRCTEQELIEAISQIQGQARWATDEARHRRKPADAGRISMMLASLTGTDPKIWEYRCTLSYSLAALDTVLARAANQDSVDADYIRAEKALGLHLKRIRNRHHKLNAKEAACRTNA